MLRVEDEWSRELGQCRCSRGLAVGTAWSHGLGRCELGDGRSFDDGVDREGRTGFELTGSAVAAVDDYWGEGEGVPDEAARTAALHWEGRGVFVVGGHFLIEKKSASS